MATDLARGGRATRECGSAARSAEARRPARRLRSAPCPATPQSSRMLVSRSLMVTGVGKAKADDMVGLRRLDARGLPSHEVSRLRPGLDDAPVFEQPVGLEHGGDAETPLAAELPHRRYAVARPEDALGDLPGDLVDQERVLGRFGPRKLCLHRRPPRGCVAGRPADRERGGAPPQRAIVAPRGTAFACLSLLWSNPPVQYAYAILLW